MKNPRRYAVFRDGRLLFVIVARSKAAARALIAARGISGVVIAAVRCD
jgi:hypothetical protein